MADTMTGGGEPSRFPLRLLGWGGAVCLLLVPLVARAPWTLSDFAVAAIMLATAGLLLELAVRILASLAYRAGAGVAILAGLLLVWVNGAVGFLGNEDNPANLIFAAVLAIAATGAAVARLEPAGMARAMLAAAGMQILIGAVALPLGWASAGAAGIYEAAMGTTLFTALWLVSAALFRKAAG